jgi:tripartite-type tricarboxylate transporter receptor subunit TctC
MQRRRHRPLAIAIASFLLGAPAAASAQDFPSSVIRIVVGSDASSPSDIISRIIAAELMESEGWRVAVENKPGASYMIAGGEVLRRPADGHTIWALPMPAAAAQTILPVERFRIERDFVPLIKFSTSSNVLVVHPSIPAHSVTELAAYLKAHPDQLTFSSGGFGTPAHLIGEMFKLHTGTRATHVPYPGAMSNAIADLLSGINQFQFITTLPVIQLIATGRLRALAVTGSRRIAALPDVPTVAEQGFPDLTVEDWVGFALKSGTAADVVQRLNKALNNTLATESTRMALAKIGAEPAGGSPEAFGDQLRNEMAKWAKVVREARITAGR